MDLLTVAIHEVGHELGYGDHLGGNDIMTTHLYAGMRRLPEALAASGAAQATPVDGSTASAARALSFAALPQAVLAPTQGKEENNTADPLPTAVHSTTLVTVTGKVAAQQLVTAASRSADAVPVIASPAGAAPVAAIVVSAPGADFAPAPASVHSAMWQSSGGDAVLIGGLGSDLQIGGQGRDVLLGGIGGDSAVQAHGSFVELPKAWTVESDTCFADGSWMADGAGRDVVAPEGVASSAGPVLKTAVAAVAALAVLGSHWAEPRTRTEQRVRPRLVM
jgi:Ca2+-binding RTX toxin-like protein